MRDPLTEVFIPTLTTVSHNELGVVMIEQDKYYSMPKMKSVSSQFSVLFMPSSTLDQVQLTPNPKHTFLPPCANRKGRK